MNDILVLYTSITGNTKTMADEIISTLHKENYQVDVKRFEDEEIAASDLLHYKAIFIGVYTWSAGDVPLDAEVFFDDLVELDLTDKIVSVFGSADSSYEQYGTAVELFFNQAKKLGAHMIDDQVISDLAASQEELKRCQALASRTINLLKKGVV